MTTPLHSPDCSQSADDCKCRPPVTETPKPWRAEVTTSDVGGNRWSSNGLRFETRDEALAYASDLSGRWMMVTRWRAVDETVPRDQAYEAGSEDGGWV